MWELCSLIFRFLVQHKPSETHLAQITRSQEFIYSSCWWAYSRVPAHKTSNLVGQQHASFHWRFQHQPWSRVFIQKRYGQQHPERMRRWNKSYLHSLPCLSFIFFLLFLLCSVTLTFRHSTMEVSEQYKFQHAAWNRALALRPNTWTPINSPQLWFSLLLLTT